jgi:LacI family transcriptional regulator
MASLADVAKAAGVSLTTASLVLNRPKQPNRVSDACAQRVRDVAQRVGYIPNYHARSMKLGRAEAIAVAMDVTTADDNGSTVSELADAYYSHLIGGIELHLRDVGYQMTLIGPSGHVRAPQRGLEGLRQRRFDGMIVLGAVVVDPGQRALMAESPDCAIVAIEYAGETQFPVVDYDERLGVELAVGHLGDFGHKRLLWVGPEPEVDGREMGRRTSRETLFAEAAAAAGATVEFCRFVPYHTVGCAERAAQVEQAHAAVRRHLRTSGRGAFTAVVAHNDPIGLGACRALAEADLRVPRDVSVVGSDGLEAAFGVPRLTTVDHRLCDLGRRAAELVMELVNDEGARKRLRGTREVLRPALAVGESTGPVARG